MIAVKRIYDSKEADGTTRFLVDRIWPRGQKKESLHLDAWIKEVGPSTELRRWFGHDPKKWDEFRRRYFAELDAAPATWQPILEAARQGDVTLLFGARDEAHNNAVALKEYLDSKLA